MRFQYLVLIFAAWATSAIAQEAAPSEPIPERVVGLCSASSVSSEDLEYLDSLARTDVAATPLVHALLFKLSPEKYRDQFCAYFRIDKTTPKTPLPDEQINEAVNSVIKEFKGRSPAEVMARVYKRFRHSGLYRTKPDGTEISLEMMFRGSVFAAVIQGPKEEILKFSAQADVNE